MLVEHKRRRIGIIDGFKWLIVFTVSPILAKESADSFVQQKTLSGKVSIFLVR